MLFQVTAIEFDFEDAFGEFSEHQFSNITDQTLGMLWVADDEDDLVDEITDATGWCIKSIEFVNILS